MLRSSELARWLQHRAPVLTASQVTELRARAVDPATWGATAIEEPDLAAFAELRDAVASAERRRVAWALGGMLAVPTAMLTFSGALPAFLMLFS